MVKPEKDMKEKMMYCSCLLDTTRHTLSEEDEKREEDVIEESALPPLLDVVAPRDDEELLIELEPQELRA